MRELGSQVHRTVLGDGAWVDLRPGWLGGADVLFDRLRTDVPWWAEERVMFDRTVAVPRLLCFYNQDAPLPDPALTEARRTLGAHYAVELGEPFATAGLCLYRDGRDSVAWHGDRFGRSATQDTMVAILSLGSPRALLLRPRSGGPSRRYVVGHGDLLVMGRQLPANLGSRGAEDGPAGRPADQCAVPDPGCAMRTGRRRSLPGRARNQGRSKVKIVTGAGSPPRVR